MAEFLYNLLRDPNASPELLAGGYRWLKGKNSPVSVTIVRHKAAPAEVLEDAANSRDPEVRAAWLLRPERTIDELVAAVESERRGDVLAAIARSDQASTELIGRLAQLHKRPVAWALVGRDVLESPDIAAIVETLDPAMRTATQRQRQSLERFVRRNAAHVVPQALTMIAPTLLAALASADNVELSYEVQQHIVNRCIADVDPAQATKMSPWDLCNMAEQVAGGLTSRGDLDLRTVDKIRNWAEAQGRQRHALRILDLLGALGPGANGTVADALAGIDDETDPARLVEMWKTTPANQSRTDLIAALWKNPATPYEVLYETATGNPRAISAEMLELRADGLEDRELASFVCLGAGWVKVLRKFAKDDEVFRRAAIEVLLQRSRYGDPVGDLREQGLVDRETIGEMTIAALGRCHDAEVRSWVSAKITHALGQDVTAWSLFSELCQKGTLPLDAILNTSRAAIQ